MSLIWVLIVLECAKWSILPNGNFREFFLWRGGFCVFEKGIPGGPDMEALDQAPILGPPYLRILQRWEKCYKVCFSNTPRWTHEYVLFFCTICSWTVFKSLAVEATWPTAITKFETAQLISMMWCTDLYYSPDAVLPVHIVSSDEATAKVTS